MRLRAFLIGSAAAALSATWARAQTSSDRIVRLGFLRATTVQERDFRAFRDGLADLGYVEGRNVLIETRHADGALARLPQLAEEIARWRPDLVVVDGNPSAFAMRAASVGSSTPVVFVVVADPVRLGFATSLSRPGGTMTGLSNLAIDLVVKRVELLKEALPGLARLGVLIQPSNYAAEHRAQVQDTARALGITLDEHAADTPSELPGALEALTSSGVRAALSVNSPLFYSERERIVAALNGAGIAGMHPEREFVEAGGLVSYGIDFPAQWRRAASFVDRILHGAKPRNLPIEQPVRFELVVSAKTARALALTLPPSFLSRADEVIE
jgi:putative tryptophan/tyrosine transport system substrate-binding protein